MFEYLYLHKILIKHYVKKNIVFNLAEKQKLKAMFLHLNTLRRFACLLGSEPILMISNNTIL